MREEINLDNMVGIAGGKYVINGNTNQVAFREIRKVYKLKGSPYKAMELMDGLIGVYPTEEEYDYACISILQDNGLI